MDERIEIKNLNRDELKALICGLGKEDYRAQQIMRWVYRHRVDSFQKMSNLGKDLRNLLDTTSRLELPTVARTETSADGSQKFLFVLADGQPIESVLIPDKKRLTLCISSQSGCAFGCRFCLTGKSGFSRNLSSSEIIGQILAVQNTLGLRNLTNIVLMGMGEPLANFRNTMKALEIMGYEDGLRLSRRKITLSTAGLVPGIERLGRHPRFCRLAVSLNATDNTTRTSLMPINQKHPIEDLLVACQRFPLAPRERITFEYVLIRGVNDTEADAHRLPRLLKGIPSKVNLIPYNPSPHLPFERPEEDRILAFQEILLREDLTAIIRESRGTDISAACGQLRGNRRRQDPPNPPSNFIRS